MSIGVGARRSVGPSDHSNYVQLLPPAGTERHFFLRRRRMDVLLGRWVWSVGLVCQGNFGPRLCRRSLTLPTQSAFSLPLVRRRRLGEVRVSCASLQIKETKKRSLQSVQSLVLLRMNGGKSRERKQYLHRAMIGYDRLRLDLFPYRMNAPVTSATTEDTCLLGHPDWLKFQRRLPMLTGHSGSNAHFIFPPSASMNNKQKSHPMENRLGIPFPITLAYCGLRIRDRERDVAF
ncbi:hypothetical protein DPX16_18331 [Anabarilius grahami]|uniref:Uncharacterized protein n=1 Tax=Anabarilius grahami TaxID=495550 RepID=A0A3N0YFJ8_ANAGA|nr:hypothetical protein DPX16_18331 [Anabarilius grahami]